MRLCAVGSTVWGLVGLLIPTLLEPRQFYYQCQMTDVGQMQDLVFDLLTLVQSCASILPCWNVFILFYYMLELCFLFIV